MTKKSFLPGTTSSLNLLAIAANDSWLAGGTVVISEAEHHANLVSWELACQRSGATIKKYVWMMKGW